jgi:hypothetical protein
MQVCSVVNIAKTARKKRLRLSHKRPIRCAVLPHRKVSANEFYLHRLYLYRFYAVPALSICCRLRPGKSYGQITLYAAAAGED